MYDAVTIQRSGRNWKVMVSNSHKSYGVVYLYDNLDDAITKMHNEAAAIELDEAKTASQSHS